MADSDAGSSRDTAEPPDAAEPARPKTPPRRGPRERALLALSLALLVAVILAVALAPGTRSRQPTVTNAAAIVTITPTRTSASSASAFPTAQQIPPGTGWTPAGPPWAQMIAFASSAPATAYVCGAPALLSNDHPVPVAVDVSYDSGATWRALTSPASGVACRLTIDPTDAQDVVIDLDSCGYCGNASRDTLYRSRDGGSTWANVTPPVQAPNGSSGPGIYAGFSSWTWVGSSLFLVPYVSGQSAWTQLVASVGGGPLVAISQRQIFGGEPAGIEINSLYATVSRLYVAFDGGSGCAQNCNPPMRATDGAASSWATVEPEYNGLHIDLLAASTDGTSLFGQCFTGPGENGRTYVSSANGGATWTPPPPFATNMIAFDMAAAPDGTLYADLYSLDGPSPAPNGIYMLSPGFTQWAFLAAWPVVTGDMLTLSWDAQGHPLALWGGAHQPSGGDLAPGLEIHPAS